MISVFRIAELSSKRSQLKSEGRFREAIPFQLEIIELLETANTAPESLASAHNVASVLCLRSRLYSSAEFHGRKALALRSDDSPKTHEARGAYNHVMAQVLACQFRFEEAGIFGDAAIAEYSHWHNHPDDYLRAIITEVQSIKQKTWAPPE